MQLTSAWRVWLAPRSAYTRLCEMEEQAAEARLELERLTAQLEDEEKALRESRRMQSQLEQLRLSMEGEVRRLQDTNAEQQKRLREWEQASIEMERVASQLEKMVSLREQMQSMRTDYEARIARLERQLWSARSNGLQYVKGAEEHPAPEESELVEPGEDPFSPPAPIRMAKERPRLPRTDDDTDWLLSLPD
ncbi:MAG: hypothetical protein K2L35_02550 [Muribaculaceae bacterium]|nr:hypothetical protein [Muribaculaceae bacterium]MDE5957954.1 hypothetical protein [Muribaculaceae bacterium]MDE6447180.1 hypothetical protein [Muribaculaceae bacterium]